MEEREEEKKVESTDKDERSMEYVIEDKTYIQKSLVLGQIKQLTKLLKGIAWPQQLDVVAIIEAITEVLPDALAIVLIEKGKDSAKELKNKDLVTMKEEFEFSVSSELIINIVNDFLSCNPINSMWSLMRGVISTTYTAPQKPQIVEKSETGSTSTLSTSQEETSLEETT